MKNYTIILVHIFFCNLLTVAVATENTVLLENISELDQELLWLQEELAIFSVNRQDESLFTSIAAAYVISSEDIRRSGVTNIPEALRLAPGIDVVQITSSQWAISVRNINNRYSNKLLILIDGRVLYNTVFSGVFWEAQDLLMHNIKRIEVIRGPGATLWGSNAVDGIINIISKSPNDTQGTKISASVTNEKTNKMAIRYGGKIKEDIRYRWHLKYKQNEEAIFKNGDRVDDNWSNAQAGFYIDWKTSTSNSYLLQGDINKAKGSDPIKDHYIVIKDIDDTLTEALGFTNDQYNTHNILASWNYNPSDKIDFILKLFYDEIELEKKFRDTRAGNIHLKIKTFDIDFQYRFTLNSQHQILWGTSFRKVTDNFDLGQQLTIAYDPLSSETQLYSFFIQEEWSPIPNRLKWILGSKFEHNDYTGLEIQPSIRFRLTPSKNTTWWGAISRVVRQPNRSDRDISPLLLITSTIALQWIPRKVPIESEQLLAYELGFRQHLTPKISLDISLFYNLFKKLRVNRSEGIINNPIPIHIDSLGKARNRGIEIVIDCNLSEQWRIKTHYSYLHSKISSPEDIIFIPSKQNNLIPNHIFSIGSFHDISKNIEFSTGIRWVDDMPDRNIEGYLDLTANLIWHPSDNLNLSLTGKHLLTPNHQEFIGSFIPSEPIELQRSIFATIHWNL